MTQTASKTIFAAAITAALAISVAACGNLGSSEADELTLPDQDTMELHLDIVSQSRGDATSNEGDIGSKEAALGSPDKDNNWFAYDHVTSAVAHTSVAGGIVSAVIAPYAAGWGACLQAGFSYNGSAFVSSTSVLYRGNTYQLDAEVTVDLASGTKHYVLTVDGQPFAVGESNLSVTQGVWELYDPTRSGQQVVAIDWSRAPDTGSVAATLVDPASQYTNTGAAYSRAGTQIALDVDIQPTGETIDITFDTASHVGSIQASNYNQGQKGCWDELYKDTPCQ